MPRHSPCALISLTLISLTNEKSPIIGSLVTLNYAGSFSRYFCLAKIVLFTLWHFNKRHQKFPLLLPSHNCIIIHNVQFSRYNFELPKKFNEVSSCNGTSVNFFKWWRLAGSNRWPPACKAGALPAELNPHILSIFVSTNSSVPSKLNNVKQHLVLTLGRYR